MGAQVSKTAQGLQCRRCVLEILGAWKRSDEGGFLDKMLLVIVPFFFFFKEQLYLGIIYVS